MAHPELLLESQVCFRVYALEREILAAYRPHLERLGLTYPQYLAMLALWERREASVGEVCGALGLDTGTVSPLLKRLEEKGLVERRRSPEDERSVSVRLTRKGEALEARALGIPRALAGCIFGGEDAAGEYETLRGSLDLALARLRRSGKAG
jgi:DNA-binding MarR family transcriptional regulator